MLEWLPVVHKLDSLTNIQSLTRVLSVVCCSDFFHCPVTIFDIFRNHIVIYLTHCSLDLWLCISPFVLITEELASDFL